MQVRWVRIFLLTAVILRLVDGATSMTVADLESHSGIWEGVMGAGSGEETAVRLSITIDTGRRAPDGTFTIRSIDAQIGSALEARPFGFCNLNDLRLTGNDLSGTCYSAARSRGLSGCAEFAPTSRRLMGTGWPRPGMAGRHSAIQSNRRCVSLIAGHGKGSQFSGCLSSDNTRLIGHPSGGQFLPNMIMRVGTLIH